MEKIVSRSEETLDGRKLLIKNAKSFEGRPAERKQRYQILKSGVKKSEDSEKDTGEE
jgi:hypothetical protein